MHVLRAGARGAAHARMLDVHGQGNHQQHGHHDDEYAGVGDEDLEITHVEVDGTRQQRWHGHVACALAQSHPVLQEDGHADGRDQRHEARALAHRLIGHLFDHQAIDAGDEDGDHQHQADDGPDGQAALRAHSRKRDESDIGPEHVDVTVGEIDHADDAVDHGVANGDQGVNGSE